MQEYIAKLQNQVMVLAIDLVEFSSLMKYVSMLNKYSCKELKLFLVRDISKSSVKAISIRAR